MAEHALNTHERDFKMEEDVRTVESFAKLKADKKRFSQVRKHIASGIAVTQSELGLGDKPSK